MSNEELAAQVQTGDEAALLELWQQVRWLAWKLMPRWRMAARAGGLTNEDLEQTAFLALLRAVGAYDSARGVLFTTYYAIALKCEVFISCGIRTKKQNMDPLRYAAPLDAPASPDAPEDLTLGDLIEDPAATEAFQHTETFIDLEPFLSALPENQQAAIYKRFWLERTDVDAKALNIALRTLRHPQNSKRLRVLL